jgi:XisH protein
VAAKDLYHDTARIALIKDGWTITDEPFSLKVGKRDLFIDFGAEKLIVASKDERKIAVEVKSFIGNSPIKDLEQALGQYLLYSNILRRDYPDRILYLAIRDDIYHTFFNEEIVQIAIESQSIRVIVFDALKQEIVEWSE